MAETVIAVEGLTVELGGREVLKDMSFTVERGSFLAVVGPNGSGKTTLLRALYRAVSPQRGRIELLGRPLDAFPRAELGRTIGVLRQEGVPAFDFLVEELVMMGRSPYKGLLDPDTAEDRRIVDETLASCDVAALRGRSFATLSGGEKQRVLLARSLAQRPTVLLLDEPTNHLDVRHQLEVLARVRGLNLTVVAALHDLNLPFAFATEALLIDEGRLIARGEPDQVLSPDRIKTVFDVEAERLTASGDRAVLAFRTPG